MFQIEQLLDAVSTTSRCFVPYLFSVASLNIAVVSFCDSSTLVCRSILSILLFFAVVKGILAIIALLALGKYRVLEYISFELMEISMWESNTAAALPRCFYQAASLIPISKWTSGMPGVNGCLYLSCKELATGPGCHLPSPNARGSGWVDYSEIRSISVNSRLDRNHLVFEVNMFNFKSNSDIWTFSQPWGVNVLFFRLFNEGENGKNKTCPAPHCPWPLETGTLQVCMLRKPPVMQWAVMSSRASCSSNSRWGV